MPASSSGIFFRGCFRFRKRGFVGWVELIRAFTPVFAALSVRDAQRRPGAARGGEGRLGAKDRDDDFGSGLIDPSKAIQTAGDFKSVDITGAAPPRPAVQPPALPQPQQAIPPRPPALSSASRPGTPLRITH